MVDSIKLEAFLMSISNPYSSNFLRQHDKMIINSARRSRNKEEQQLNLAFFPTASFFAKDQQAQADEAKRYFQHNFDGHFEVVDTAHTYYCLRNDGMVEILDSLKSEELTKREFRERKLNVFKNIFCDSAGLQFPFPVEEITKNYEENMSVINGLFKKSKIDDDEQVLLERLVLDNLELVDGRVNAEKLSRAVKFFYKHSLKQKEESDALFNGQIEVIKSADILYVGGGSTDALMRIFEYTHRLPDATHTTMWSAMVEAMNNGATYAGNSAGGMILCENVLDYNDKHVVPAFGVVMDVGGYIPHYDDSRGSTVNSLSILSRDSKTRVYALPNDSLIRARVKDSETKINFYGAHPFYFEGTHRIACPISEW